MKQLLKQIQKQLLQRNYAKDLRWFRRTAGPGDRVVVRLTGTGAREQGCIGYITNVRDYAHGATEFYVMSDDNTFMGWVPVERTFPEKEDPQ